MEEKEGSFELRIYKNWFEDPPKVEKYGIVFLMKLVEEYGLRLIGEYEKVNRETKIEGYCMEENCEGVWRKSFRMLVERGGPRCKIHTEIKRKERNQETNIKRRGFKHHSQDPEIKAKKEETNMRKRGFKNVSQDPEIKAKKEETNMRKRGFRYNSQDPKVKAKKEETNMRKRGFRYSLQDPEVKARGIETNLQKRGVRFSSQDPEVKAKIEKTCIERYGFKSSLQHPEVRGKIEKTCIEKYGFKSPMQNREILEKSLKSAFSLKTHTLPSGKTVQYQGYEHFTWDFLLSQEKLSEEDILTGTAVPPIKWIDSEGKDHVYHCDHYIPKQKLLIETKSSWTFEMDQENNLLKQKFAREAGYKHQILIWSAKGELEDIVE